MNQKQRLGSILSKGLLCTVVLLSSCDTNDDNNEKLEKQVTNKDLKKGSFLGEEIIYIRKDGKNIFQGDMLITDEQLKENLQNRGAVANRLRWPNNTVYYTISNQIRNTNLHNRINAAIREYNSKTNLKWTEVGFNAPTYVQFVPSGSNGTDGSATIGRQNGSKYISLDWNIPLGSLLHEMGHTIGLFHEHTRRDRDNYVIINWNNIQNGQQHNFNIYSSNGIGRDGVDIGEFNAQSMMMYWTNSYSRNGQPTIVQRNGRSYTYNRQNYLIQTDINAINRMYPR